jgi:hypothetical protein
MSDITAQGPAFGLAVARVLIVEADTIVKIPLYYPRVSAFSPQVTTLSFEGQDTSQTVDVLTRVDIALTCDKRNLPSIQRIFAKTRLDAPGSGEAEGLWMGDETEVAGVTCGLELEATFKDESQSPAEVTRERLTFPYGQVKAVQPQQMEYQAKWVTVLNFSFQRTEVDILGDPLANVPAGGAVYRDSILT